MLDAELLTLELKFHGHKCPAMPMGLRARMAAMRALGVERSQDKELHMAFTLIDVRKRKAVRVSLKPAFFAAALDGPFVAQRKAGVLPQDIDPRITDPLVKRIAGLPEEQFLAIGPVVDYSFPAKKGVFEAKPCAKCGEIVFADKLLVQGGVLVCIPCSGYEK